MIKLAQYCTFETDGFANSSYHSFAGSCSRLGMSKEMATYDLFHDSRRQHIVGNYHFTMGFAGTDCNLQTCWPSSRSLKC